MRVAIPICGTKRYQGLPKYFYFLAKHLVQQGVDVELIMDSFGGLTHLHEMSGSVPIPPKIIEPPCQERFSVPATALWCWRVSRYLDEHRDEFDIVHCGHVTPYFYLKLPRERRKPIVFQPFGNELMEFKDIYGGLHKLFYGLSHRVLRSCGRNADVLVAEADWQVEEMSEYYGRPAEDIFVLPVGIDIDFVLEKANLWVEKSREQFREKWLRGNPYVLLTVNTFHHHKDYPNLIHAFDRVRRMIPEAVLIMVGTGPDVEKVHSLIDRLELKDSVMHMWDVPEDELYGLYTMCDVYVSPTLVTDFQMGILEAEALGKPVVSTAQDFLIDGNGYVVGRGDSAKLAEGIIRVYGHWSGNNNQEVYKEMCRKSRVIAERYDFKEIAKRAIEKYGEVLRK